MEPIFPMSVKMLSKFVQMAESTALPQMSLMGLSIFQHFLTETKTHIKWYNDFKYCPDWCLITHSEQFFLNVVIGQQAFDIKININNIQGVALLTHRQTINVLDWHCQYLYSYDPDAHRSNHISRPGIALDFLQNDAAANQYKFCLIDGNHRMKACPEKLSIYVFPQNEMIPVFFLSPDDWLSYHMYSTFMKIQLFEPHQVINFLHSIEQLLWDAENTYLSSEFLRSSSLSFFE